MAGDAKTERQVLMDAASIKLWLLPRSVGALLALTTPHLVTTLLLMCHGPQWYKIYFLAADLHSRKVYVIGTGIKLVNQSLS
jgi:hypothetical protein